MVKICALCAQISTLRDSHIIPKFIAKLLRKGSSQGRLFSPDKPGQQDAYHQPLLCDDCELRLSRLEAEAKPYIEQALKSGKAIQGFDATQFTRRLAFMVALTEMDESDAFRQDRGIAQALECWQNWLLELRTSCSDRHYALRLPRCRSTLSDGTPVSVTTWSGLDGGILSGSYEAAFVRVHDLLFLSPICQRSFTELCGMECGKVDAFSLSPELSGKVEDHLWSRMVEGINEVKLLQGRKQE